MRRKCVAQYDLRVENRFRSRDLLSWGGNHALHVLDRIFAGFVYDEEALHSSSLSRRMQRGLWGADGAVIDGGMSLKVAA